MILILDSKHVLNGGKIIGESNGKNIGVDAENYTERLDITIEEEELWTYKAYIEFETENGDKYSTSELPIVEGVISYELPNGILIEGNLDVQVVLRKKIDEKDYVWKSQVKTFYVTRSVNASEEIEKEYPDFITEAEELIDKLEEYSYEFEKLETIEEGAEVNAIETISKNGTPLTIDENRNVNIDLTEYALGSQAGANFIAEVDPATYILTFKLLDRDNNILAQRQVDLPIESVVVSGRYDNATKSLILTLQSGSIITIPVGDLISGLQAEITNNNKLASDLVDDTNNLHKFVTQGEKDKLRDIEANAQVNVLEGLKVNGVALPIDNNKQSNLDLTSYIGAVPVSDIRALFESEESGGGE